jgi:hypothetical protein
VTVHESDVLSPCGEVVVAECAEEQLRLEDAAGGIEPGRLAIAAPAIVARARAQARGSGVQHA